MSPARSLYTSNFRTFNTIGYRLVDRIFSSLDEIKDVSVVLVSHSMFTGMPAVKAAERIAGKKNLHLVLKNSSKNQGFRDYLEMSGYSILNLEKDDFKKRPERVIEELKTISGDEKPLFLLDHGGYGAYFITDYAKELNIAGISEYALNGRTRYEKRGIGKTKIPFTSIAEADVKLDPDYSCGRLIGEMTAHEAQMHNGFGIHLRGIVQAGVIGYGKLGSKAAETLVRNGAHNVMIYDKDPAKVIHAAGEGFNVSARNVGDIVNQCNVIVVGTDTAPIEPEMYAKMQQDTIISTVTSPDDTLDLDKLVEKGVIKKRRHSGRMYTYEHEKPGKFVHLVCDGDAPNLRDYPFGVNDTTLFMPTTLHAYSGWELLKNGPKISPERMKEMETTVRERYLDVYQWVLQNPEKIRSNGHQHR